MVPFWVKEMPKAAMFNAHIERHCLAFRDAFKSKRCLMPVDGFMNGPRAGLMVARIRGISSCPITRHSHLPDCGLQQGARHHELHHHHRSRGGTDASASRPKPLILDPAYYDAWLDAQTPAGDLKSLLTHDIDGQLQFNRVSRAVNATVVDKLPNDHAGLIGPVNPL
jgi:hypothetical protein